MLKLNKLNNLLWPLIVIVASIIFSWPFFKSGFFISDDGSWAVIRLSEMVREIKDFQIPPRWSDYLNHGYGYPLFSFTYPFPFYIGSLFKLLGFSYVVSIKILFASSVILSGLFMYLFVNKVFGARSAFLSSVFYIIAPYRLTDMYIRGSLGESLSFVLFPLIFYLTLNLFEKASSKNQITLSAFIGILFLTHNIMSLFFICIWLSFVVFLIYSSKKNKKDLTFSFLQTLTVGISLSAFFIIPALLEKKYIYLSIYRIADQLNYFLTPKDLLTPSINPELPSFNIGIPLVIGIILTLTVILKNSKKTENFRRNLYYLFSALLLISVLLTQKFTSPVWQIPLLYEIDFPWRIMAVVVFTSAFLVAYLGIGKKYFVIGCFLLGVSILTNFKLVRPGVAQVDNNDLYYITNDATTTSNDELMPVWVKEKPKNRYFEKIEILDGDAKISDLSYNSKSLDFKIDANTSGRLKINTIYFPGWKVYSNGKEININYNNSRGLINIDFFKGKSQISGRFTNTPVRKIADTISLSALLLILVKLFYVRKV